MRDWHSSVITRVAAGLVLCVSMASNCLGADAPKYHGRRVVGYYTAWSIYARKFGVSQIPAERLTHINYAFANVSPKGECVLGDPWADAQKTYPGDKQTDSVKGNFKQLLQLKRKHPHLKTLISVGGWTWSARFSDAAFTPASRQRFARSCVAFMKRYGFDGVDIDWEYPVAGGEPGNKTRPEDKQNLTLLLAEVRRHLDAQGKQDKRDYLLTIAATAGPDKIPNLEVEAIAHQLDWMNVMTYDFNGSWSARTGFNSPLFAPADSPHPEDAGRNANAAVQTYLKAGLPRNKLVLGVPFYGRGWKGVVDEHDGLYQRHQGVPRGTWEPGSFDYKDLRRNDLGGFARHWNDVAKVPWLYDPRTRTMISYDDVESVTAKANYVAQQDLGGVMIWELSQDTTDHTSLLRSISTVLSKQP